MLVFTDKKTPHETRGAFSNNEKEQELVLMNQKQDRPMLHMSKRLCKGFT